MKSQKKPTEIPKTDNPEISPLEKPELPDLLPEQPQRPETEPNIVPPETSPIEDPGESSPSEIPTPGKEK